MPCCFQPKDSVLPLVIYAVMIVHSSSLSFPYLKYWSKNDSADSLPNRTEGKTAWGHFYRGSVLHTRRKIDCTRVSLFFLGSFLLPSLFLICLEHLFFSQNGVHLISLQELFLHKDKKNTGREGSKRKETMSLEHEMRKTLSIKKRTERKGRIYCLTEWQLLSKLVRFHHLIIVMELHYVSLGLDSHGCLSLCIRHVSRHRMNDRKEHCLLWHETPD